MKESKNLLNQISLAKRNKKRSEKTEVNSTSEGEKIYSMTILIEGLFMTFATYVFCVSKKRQEIIFCFLDKTAFQDFNHMIHNIVG